MAGQAAFDFVFKEMLPGGMKKDNKPPSNEDGEDASSKQLSVKWRPSVSELANDAQDEKDSSQEAAGCSWGSLQAPNAKTSLSLEIHHEHGQVQLALENGQLALEDQQSPGTKRNHGKNNADRQKHDGNQSPTKSPLKKRPAAAVKKPTNKQEGPSTKKQKATEGRKTFANRPCPPGPDGSTRFKAIENAYNTVIKNKICRNKEVGFC